MTPEQDQRVRAIFEEVLKADPAGRAALLDELCAGDLARSAEVERLLADDERASRDKFLTPPAAPAQGADGGRRFPFRLQDSKCTFSARIAATRLGWSTCPSLTRRWSAPPAGRPSNWSESRPPPGVLARSRGGWAASS